MINDKKNCLRFLRSFLKIDPSLLMDVESDESKSELKYYLGTDMYGRLEKRYENLPRVLKIFYNMCKSTLYAVSDAKDLRINKRVFEDKLRLFLDEDDKKIVDDMKVLFQEYLVNKFSAKINS